MQRTLDQASASEPQWARGFERVRDAFTANFSRGDDYEEVGAALCVYLKGKCVVDIWGGYRDKAKTKPWTADTLINVWSTTKGLTATAVALLVDRGLVRYEDPVTSVWPEFAASGKEKITIAQLLSHQAGLPGFAQPTTIEDQFNWKAMVAQLARQKPAWEPGTQNSYHAMTYGWLAGEVAQRVAKRELGELVRHEIAEKLSADFFVGLPPEFDSRAAEVIGPRNPVDTSQLPLPEVAKMALENPAQDPLAPNTTAWRRAEIPAANGHASARGVARLYAALANGGELDSRRLLSPATIAQMTKVQTTRTDLMLGFAPCWAMGFATNQIGIYGPNPKSFGHSGWGGSFGFADPDIGLAVGYVMNQMGADLVGDPRTTPLCKEIYASL